MSSVIGNRRQAAANRARAPITAALVEAMRNQFGAVKIEHVSEGEVKLGAVPQFDGTFVSCVDIRLPEEKKK